MKKHIQSESSKEKSSILNNHTHNCDFRISEGKKRRKKQRKDLAMKSEKSNVLF
jgi:hypothetical protein